MASKIHTPSQHVSFRALELGTITSSNGTSVDGIGYGAAAFEMVVTTAAASTLDAKLQESADNSSWADVPSGAIATIAASQTKAATFVEVNLAKRKRYLRWVYTITGTVTGCTVANLFMPEALPVTQTATLLQVI